MWNFEVLFLIGLTTVQAMQEGTDTVKSIVAPISYDNDNLDKTCVVLYPNFLLTVEPTDVVPASINYVSTTIKKAQGKQYERTPRFIPKELGLIMTIHLPNVKFDEKHYSQFPLINSLPIDGMKEFECYGFYWDGETYHISGNRPTPVLHRRVGIARIVEEKSPLSVLFEAVDFIPEPRDVGIAIMYKSSGVLYGIFHHLVGGKLFMVVPIISYYNILHNALIEVVPKDAPYFKFLKASTSRRSSIFGPHLFD